MTINSLKELQRLITLCRKTGVTSIKIDGIEFNLGPLPAPKQAAIDFSNDFPEASIPVPKFQGYQQAISEPGFAGQLNSEQVQAVADKIATSELTDEQLLFYSARPEAFEQGQQ